MNQSILSRRTIPMLLAGSVLLVSAVERIVHAQAATPTVAPTPVVSSKPPFTTPLRWKSTGVLVAPVSDETHNLVSVKDPTIVRFNDLWHIFATTANTQGNWSMVYLSFADWKDATN